MNAHRALLPLALALLATPAVAQQQGDKLATIDTTRRPAAAAQQTNASAGVAVQPAASRGFNAFEGQKFEGPFDGVKISVGGAFNMNFQALDHENGAAPGSPNHFGEIRPGFALPSANLNLNVQLAPGINMVLESYMASRHHNEFWVKGGYATIDRSPIDLPVLNRVFEHTTVRAGMYEPFYGDALYRRADNGNTLQNPFAENLILDAFTTEPGMDALVRLGDAFVMLGVTTGENKGNVRVTRNAADSARIDASPAFVGKVGVDRQVNEMLRVRLSGSVYTVSSSPASTLYAGDRTGSNYWGVLETQGSLNDGKAFTNGRLNPGFRNEITAFQINPFVKVGGLELFGVIERATGRAVAEEETREMSQYAGDAVLRFLDDRLYVAGRYNVVRGDLSATVRDIEVDRKVVSAGWFISPNLLTKVEYITQSHSGWAQNSPLYGANFNGFVVQGSIAF